MRAADYMNRYLKLSVLLEDWSIPTVSIDRYLNLKFVKNAGSRAARAWAEKDKLLGQLMKETKSKSIPSQFVIGGIVVRTKDIVRVFSGKGSPSKIRTLIWLASRYGHTSWTTAEKYARDFIGLDCNGFVGNYFGVDPEMPIGWYDKQRRKDYGAIAPDDAIIYYKPNDPTPFHIAVIDSITKAGNPVTMDIVQSAGNEVGVHKETFTDWKMQKNQKGEVFHKTDDGNFAYLAPKPTMNEPTV